MLIILSLLLSVSLPASLGDISRFVSFTDFDKVNSYLSLNVSSALTLTAGILQVFPCRPGLRWTVVNISSVFALQAIQSWVLYCTAKAAREMMFRVLAEEEPNIKVLSYSPGTVYTDFTILVKQYLEKIIGNRLSTVSHSQTYLRTFMISLKS